jgi:hypothetical protein
VFDNQEENTGVLWQSGQTVVEFPRIVLQQLLTFAEEGLRKLSRGGIEQGGVLFGRRAGKTVQVHAWREIPCQHLRGPAFLLSNEDKQGLAALLENAQRDPALQVLEPVGWFVSHTRQGLSLTDDDQDVGRQFFGEPQQISVVLHPVKGKATEGILFVRDSAGELVGEDSRRSFESREFPPVMLPEIGQPEPAQREMTRPARQAHAGAGMKTRPNSAPPPAAAAASDDAPFWRRVPGWAYASIGVLLCGALVLAIPTRRGPEESTGEALQLRLQDAKGQLRIEWDKNSRTILGADGATLYVTDGRPLAPVELDKDTAQRGFITYGRLSEDVTVRMVVKRAKDTPYQELARFVGAPVPKEVPRELRESRERKEHLLAEIRKLRQQIQQEVERSQTLETSVSRLEQQIERESRRAR